MSHLALRTNSFAFRCGIRFGHSLMLGSAPPRIADQRDAEICRAPTMQLDPATWPCPKDIRRRLIEVLSADEAATALALSRPALTTVLWQQHAHQHAPQGRRAPQSG